MAQHSSANNALAQIAAAATFVTNPQQQQAVHAVTQQRRRRAGPQLNPGQQPWKRPQGQANQASWPGRPANWAIPLLAMPENVSPDGDTTDQQVVINALEQMDAYWQAGNRRGPAIITREVSSNNAANRDQLFQTIGSGSQKRMYDAQNPNAPGMRLVDYSMTATDAVQHYVKPAEGTIVLLASRAQPNQLATLDRQSPYNTFVASLPPYLRGPGVLNAWFHSHVGAHEVWHNSAALVIRIQRHPGNPGLLPNLGADGVYERVYIYDPSFINQNDVNRPVTAAQEENEIIRLSNMLMLHNTRKFCEAAIAKAGWVRTSMFIGGGGNTAGLDECRRMSFNWI